MQEQKIRERWRVVVRVLLWLVSLGILIGAIIYFKILVLTVLLALIVAYFLNPLVIFLSGRILVKSNRQTARLVATSVAFLLVILILVGIGFRVWSPLIAETTEFINDLPAYSKKLQQIFTDIQATFARIHLPANIQEYANSQLDKFVTTVTKTAQGIVFGIVGGVSHIIEWILIPVLAFFFLIGSRDLKREFVFLVSRKKRRRVLRLLKETNVILNAYISGIIVICISLAIVASLGFYLFGMHKFAITLGLVVGVTRAIPIIGQIVGAIPPIVVASINSWQLGLWVFLFLVVIHALETKIFFPIVVGKKVKLHPVLVIAVLLAGWQLFGILGMFLAVPVGAIIRMMVNFYYVEPQLQLKGYGR